MKLSTILRIAGILLGIAVATLFAMDGLNAPHNPASATAANGIRAFVAVITSPFEVFLVAPFVDWLHGQNVALELRDHWRAAFILLWLLNGTTANAFTETTPAWLAIIWALSGVAALVTSVAVGSVTMQDGLLFLYAVAGWSWFYAAVLVLVWLFRRESQAWFFAYFLIIGAVNTVRWLAWEAHEMPFVATLPNPILAVLAVTFAALGVANVTAGAFIQDGEGDTMIDNWLRSSLAKAGLDILMVLGGATAIIYWTLQLG